MPKSWERVFIGRDQELDSLASIWQDVRAGSPRLAVILGETGLGKTRLVQQFYECIAAEQTQSESISSAYWPPQLSVGRNLSLQPKIQNDSADIPWLWWAMRFPFPSRRNDLGFVSPFEAQDKNLAANAEPILRKRNRRQVNIDASLTFSTIIADIASVGLVGSALSLFDLYKARQLERANADKSITELEIERVRELVDKTLSVLRLFMDAKQADSPQVPVIIVLDDAQWIDSLSLQALFHIFAEAKSNQWPLMVLATHWEKEWNEAEQKLESDFEFRQLRQVYEHFEHEDEQLGHLLNLSKISTQHLHQIVEQALPGVAIGERDMLVEEAGGNPRALEEMLRILLDRPERYFVDGDPAGALSDRGQQKLAKLKFTDLYEKIRERFDDLPDDLQQVLMASALFGVRFQRPIVVDLIRLAQKLDDENHHHYDSLFSVAESIHVLIESLSDTGHEFTQKIYQTVAHDYMKEELPGLFKTMAPAVNTVIDQWLVSGAVEQLEVSDQIDLYYFAVESMIDGDNSGSEDYVARARAFDRLAHLAIHNNSETRLAQLWLQLILQQREIPIAFFQNLVSAPKYLYDWATYDSQLVESVISFATNIAASLHETAVNDQLNRAFVAWHLALGVLIKKLKNDDEQVLNCFQTALDRAKEWVDLNNIEDVSEQWLELLANSIGHIADIEFNQHGELELAKSMYEQELLISKRIVERFGESADRSRYVAVVHSKLGNLEAYGRLDFDQAREHFNESVVISRAIVNLYGATPRTLRDITVTLFLMSGLELRCSGRTEQAVHYARDSASTSQAIIDNFGESPKRLEDLAQSQNRYGRALVRQFRDSQNDDALDQAHKVYLSALEIIRTAVEKYGETATRLTIKSITLSDIVLVYEQKKLLSHELLNWAQQAFDVTQRIIECYGENQNRLRAFAVEKNKIGEIKEMLGYSDDEVYQDYLAAYDYAKRSCTDFNENTMYVETARYLANKLAEFEMDKRRDVDAAIKFTEDAVRWLQLLIERHGESRQRLDDLYVRLFRLGTMLERQESSKGKAAKIYQRSLTVLKQLIAAYGETPNWLKSKRVIEGRYNLLNNLRDS